MRKHLQPADLQDLLKQPKCATLATHFKNGTVLLSPVWHEWQNGGFTVAAAADDIKIRHIRRNDQVSISLAEDVAPYQGIEVRGSATIEDGEGLETIRRIAIRYLGSDRGISYAKLFDGAHIQLIRVRPGTFRGWDFSDEAELAVPT